MRPMNVLRRWQFDELRHGVNILEYILQSTSQERLTFEREKPEGWTVVEIIGHLLDCERLFVERAKLTMEKDLPDLPFPNQDEDVKKGRYNDCDPHQIFHEWKKAREEYLCYLNTIPEDSWNREGKHPVYAPLSLNVQLALACRHTLLHMEQITRILSKRQN